jgi:hypothetical protein
MDVKTLVFSDNRWHRIARHVLFWVSWFALWYLTSTVGLLHMPSVRQMLIFDFLIMFQSNWLNVPFCYLIIYGIVPKYFSAQRNTLGVFMFFVTVTGYIVLRYFNLRITTVPISAFMHREPMDAFEVKFYAVRGVIAPMGLLVCCALVGSIRFLKFWYIKQQENVALVRESAVAELQLLKAQVHPHFLFNTLNNIYSFTLTKSPFAADLIEKLSTILHYMIMEGQKNAVPLQKEIDLVLAYASLEKVRYGNRLDITVSVQGESEHRMIAPLLMIPFVENAFKHGSSQLLNNPKINIAISVTGNELLLNVMNNKPAAKNEPLRPATKGGIGLKNVRKRLQLLYPGNHTLVIEAGDTTFTVKMIVILSTHAQADIAKTPESTLIAYANT